MKSLNLDLLHKTLQIHNSGLLNLEYKYLASWICCCI